MKTSTSIGLLTFVLAMAPHVMACKMTAMAASVLRINAATTYALENTSPEDQQNQSIKAAYVSDSWVSIMREESDRTSFSHYLVDIEPNCQTTVTPEPDMEVD